MAGEAACPLKNDMKALRKHKRILCALLACFLLLAVLPWAKAAERTGTVNSSNGVNVRSGPGTNYSAPYSLANGTTVTILNETAGADGYIWYYIRTPGGNYGYIRSDLLKVNADPQTQEEEEKTGKVINVTSSLNVRSGPGTGYTKITTLSGGAIVTITGTASGSDGYTWYMIKLSGGTVGYVRSDYIQIMQNTTPETPDTPDTPDPPPSGGDVTQTEAEYEARLAKFPVSYQSALRELHKQYPNWVFQAQYVQQDWDYAVGMEYRDGYSLVENFQPSSWKALESYAYNWTSGEWTIKDSGRWVCASREIISYYMDPRNFLDSESIFMFLDQSFDSSQTVAGVKTILAGSFMDREMPDKPGVTYSECIYNAGKTYGANPYVLASKILTEQGKSGSSLVSGTVSGYTGYYNFFNYNAYGATSSQVISNGLKYAMEQGWNTREKSINGGTQKYVSGYISSGQETMYLERFNVSPASSSLFSHQYMTSVYGVYNQAWALAKGYTAELRTKTLVFKIPVYDDMPASACAKPTGTGSPNMKLTSLSVSGCQLTPAFSADTTSYAVTVPAGTTSITVSAQKADSKATVTGTGTVALSGANKQITVKVTAENGVVRNYTIDVTVVGAPAGQIAFSGKYPVSGGVITVPSGTTPAKLTAELLTKGSVTVMQTGAGGDKLATGDLVLLRDTAGESYGVYGVAVQGDMNGDAALDMKDVSFLFQFWTGTGALQNDQLAAGDVNGDGIVDLRDAAALYLKCR